MTIFLFAVLIVLSAALIRKESKKKGHTRKIMSEIENRRKFHRKLKKQKMAHSQQTSQLGDLYHTGVELWLDEDNSQLIIVETGKEPEIYKASQILQVQVIEQPAKTFLSDSLHKPKRIISEVALSVTLDSPKRSVIHIPYAFLSPGEYEADYIQNKVTQYKDMERRLNRLKTIRCPELGEGIV